MLAPYNLDLVSDGQNIFFRSTKDQAILDLADRDVSYKSIHPFKSKEVIIVTFNRVPRYNHQNMIFTFQTILATDYTKTYAILNYIQLDADARQTGFSYQQGVCKTSQRFSNKSSLVYTSNVGVPGKHVHLLILSLKCINKNGTEILRSLTSSFIGTSLEMS